MADSSFRHVNIVAPGATAALGAFVDVLSGGLSQIRSFTAAEAIVCGDVLELDWSAVGTAISTAGVAATVASKALVQAAIARVRVSDTNSTTGAKGIIGVAMEDAASGASVRVCVGGYCPAVSTSGGGVAKGDFLCSVTAGTVILYAGATHTTGKIMGFALSDDAAVAGIGSGTYCSMWLYPTCP